MDPIGALTACRLCPRMCGVNRLAGERGWCGAGADARVARAMLHFGEEPPLSGTKGSGAVFFSRCNLRCLFCQNHEISWGGAGREISPSGLARIFLRLQAQGAHNINLVSPTPYIPQIAAALREARADGLRLPVVYNSNAYERPEALAMLRGLVQIYLPDLKYADDDLARRFSAAPGYFAAAAAALQTMRMQGGADRFDADGLMAAGLILRHLVLPGQGGDTRRILRWVAGHLGKDTYLSLMSQYTPVFKAAGHPVLGRRLCPEEYEQALAAMEAAGLENGFYQGMEAAGEEYTPEFNLEGVEE